MVKFFDTNALLILQDEIFKLEDEIYISNITFKELENIKSSGTTDNEVKWQARNILRLLAENEDKDKIVLYKSSYEDDIKQLIINKHKNCFFKEIEQKKPSVL